MHHDSGGPLLRVLWIRSADVELTGDLATSAALYLNCNRRNSKAAKDYSKGELPDWQPSVRVGEDDGHQARVSD